MNRTAKGVLVLAAVAAIGLGFALNERAALAQQNEAKGLILFNVTSGQDDLHAATMAMQLAGHALDDGRKVVIFLNVRAPVFASKKAEGELAFLNNADVPTMLKALMKRGAELLVCPHCMEAMKVTEADLIDGAEVATRESLFGPLGPNAVVFSY